MENTNVYLLVTRLFEIVADDKYIALNLIMNMT